MASVHAFIDGLSLYYGAAKGKPYRWLDLCEVCDLVLRNDQVEEVRYYLAWDPDSIRRSRQRRYVEALKTLDRLTIVEVDPMNPVTELGADLLGRAAET